MTSSILEVIITGATCGETCWRADEDICRCSCAGKNHGCLRDANGERPARTARIKGYMYQLTAVGRISGEDIRKVEQAAITNHIGTRYDQYNQTERLAGWHGEPGYVFRERAASASEIERWPELAAYRRENHDRGAMTTMAYYHATHPSLLWVRIDVLPHL